MDRIEEPGSLPLIALRDIVAFPSAVFEIIVGRQSSVVAFQTARRDYEDYVILVAQKNPFTENPGQKDVYSIGILASIKGDRERGNGSYKVTLAGLRRVRIREVSRIEKEGYLMADFDPVPVVSPGEAHRKDRGMNLLLAFRDYLLQRKIQLRGVENRFHSEDISSITDIMASVIRLPLDVKQKLLEEPDPDRRADRIMTIMKKEKPSVSGDGSQGRSGGPQESEEVRKYREKIAKGKFPGEVKEKLESELKRFESMPPFSAEGGVIQNYLDWMLNIPWSKVQDKPVDLGRAEEILEAEHYGLQKVKERILDYLAVRILKKQAQGEIICLLGPPGTGKSSLARSVARATGREFVRMSLGGVKDEAEIRGHRRTYIGAYPGQIVKGLKNAGCMNPVFLLDEIDKIDSNFRGDPASALMEVLDPELNRHFVDHYLDTEIDLSRIFFITTANSPEGIPGPLRDRLEVIEISSYTEEEKTRIALDYLVGKQMSKNGLEEGACRIEKEAVITIINRYTREAGVRELERQVAIIMRKLAKKRVLNAETSSLEVIGAGQVADFLGIPRYTREKIIDKPEVGVAVGMAWTEYGGEILLIESRNIRGKGELILTGRLGEIMRESSSAAFSYIKIKLYEMGYNIDDIERYNYHIHMPKGAVPKDGPSAGVTLAVSLISLITGVPVRDDCAMTGEITLRGKVLPVGGIKEKVIAAHRSGIRKVLIPRENRHEFTEYLPPDIQKELEVVFVKTMEDVFAHAFTRDINHETTKNVLGHFTNSNVQ